MEKLEKILEILQDIQPGTDYRNLENLIDGHYLSSLSILALVAELEEAFDVTVPAVEIIPANFNSANAMLQMIERLEEEG
ncbi:MAG: acyl carrier protein [Lachnospiraceae bacterium]|nr:acyl carrier protein [Lachnospiraceae bacterium]